MRNLRLSFSFGIVGLGKVVRYAFHQHSFFIDSGLCTGLRFANMSKWNSSQYTAMEFHTIQDHIFPIIKVTEPDSLNNGQTGIDIPASAMPMHTRIAGDLLCVYGVDKGEYLELLQQGQLPKDVTPQFVDSISQANLFHELDGKIQLYPTAFGGYGFTCGGEYEAALITMPWTWSIAEKQVGTKIVFAVSSKDLLVFVDANDSTAIAGLQALVQKVHLGGDRLLSQKLFTYSNGKIGVYQTP